MKIKLSDTSNGKIILSRKFIITLIGVGTLFSILLFTAGVVLAGNLEPPVGPDEAGSQMYTLDQIYKRLYSGQVSAKMTTFTEPIGGPSTGTMHTLDEIYDLIGQRAPVPKTGQTTSWAANDDGALEKGVSWPNPRFTINTDGTVTDNLTGLIWLRNANCTLFFNGDAKGQNNRFWNEALVAASSLSNGYCGLDRRIGCRRLAASQRARAVQPARSPIQRPGPVEHRRYRLAHRWESLLLCPK